MTEQVVARSVRLWNLSQHWVTQATLLWQVPGKSSYISET